MRSSVREPARTIGDNGVFRKRFWGAAAGNGRRGLDPLSNFLGGNDSEPLGGVERVSLAAH
jgi:hypothetical protein